MFRDRDKLRSLQRSFKLISVFFAAAVAALPLIGLFVDVVE